VVVLGSLPRSFSGHSILMISAPKAPSQRVAHGPARTQLKSTTRMFSRARGRDIASFSCQGWLAERDTDKAEHQQCPNGMQQNIYTAVTGFVRVTGCLGSEVRGVAKGPVSSTLIDLQSLYRRKWDRRFESRLLRR
jgi:hypothetical protein